MKFVVIAGLLFASGAWAQNAIIYPTKTVSDCTNDLVREMLELKRKTAEKYCREYSQETIDCARQLAEAKKLTYSTFEKALKDCTRVHNK